jgi:hypothetical protein
MRPYPELPGLEALYLEDSYVLGVHENASEVRFELDAVLTQDHPKWSQPPPDQQYAYLRVDLVFPNARRIEWVERAMRPVSDPAGGSEYGNIDSFEWPTNYYDLLGEWGHVRIESDPPLLVEA